MMTATNRDVIYTIKVVADPGNNRIVENLLAVEKQVQEAAAKTERIKTTSRDREEKAAEKAAKAEEQRQARVFQNRVKLLARMADDQRKAEEANARAHEQAVGKMASAHEKLKGSIMAGTEGLIRMGRGAAMLGVVGEKDAKKLLDALVKIQAAYDIAKGAVDFYWHITEAVKAYRTAVLAAAAAEQALGAARGKSAAMGDLSAASGGIGGSAGGLAASGVGAVGGTLAMAGGAAAAGVGAAGYAAYDIGSGGWREEGSYTRTMTKFYESVISVVPNLLGFGDILYDAGSDAAVLRDKLRDVIVQEEQVNQSAKRLEQSMQDAAKGARAVLSADAVMRRASTSAGGVTSNDAILAGKVLSQRQGEISSQLRPGVADEDALRLTAEAAVLAEKQVSLTEQRLGFEQEAAEIGIRAAREKITAAERERSIAADIVQKEKERNMTVLERFGQMSRAEQQQLLAVRQKADRFGADALSQQERAKLRSIGTASAERLAREGDVAAATAAGGAGLFRAEDYAAQRAAEQRVVQAEVVIADQRKVEVQIEANTDALVAQIQGMLSNQYDDWEAAVEAQLQRAVSVELTRQRNRINQERIAAQQSR